MRTKIWQIKTGVILAVACMYVLAGAPAWAEATTNEMVVAEAPPTVNINVADAETLASMLDGVGLQKAMAIIAYRQEHGPFYLAEELSAVKGIGVGTVAKNAERIITGQ
jgi:competence ComEA-like helix-hairpin-helix protein